MRLTVPEYVDGVLNGDRAILARAITLIESDLASDRDLAEQLLDAVLPHSGGARRVGITGIPGSGKSTFIDALGLHIVRERIEKAAVLTVDPSSPLSGGSILADKIRMTNLAAEDRAFVRPSPARGHLGGGARHTREAIVLCEAAGYDNVLIETVGVGQSEVAVRSMVDFFLLLMVPGTGDEMQGVKRGIMEMPDAIAINKADGENKERAERLRGEYENLLRLFPPRGDGWIPAVVTCSAATGYHVSKLWDMVLRHQEQIDVAQRRRNQALDWMRELISQGLEEAFSRHPAVNARIEDISEAVRRGDMTPVAGARSLLALFD